jgi:hypothetical protein
MDMQDFRAALVKLPDDQREALVLVGAAGFSYEEAAEISGCAVGTIKPIGFCGLFRVAAFRRLHLRRMAHGFFRCHAVVVHCLLECLGLRRFGLIGGCWKPMLTP